MTRKQAILNMHDVLIKRRDALRKALAGDLSLLKELSAQTSGDVVDAALDSVQDEISSQLAEVESRELARIENALERMRDGQYGICEGCASSFPWHGSMPCPTPPCASSASGNRSAKGPGHGATLIGAVCWTPVPTTRTSRSTTSNSTCRDVVAGSHAI